MSREITPFSPEDALSIYIDAVADKHIRCIANLCQEVIA